MNSLLHLLLLFQFVYFSFCLLNPMKPLIRFTHNNDKIYIPSSFVLQTPKAIKMSLTENDSIDSLKLDENKLNQKELERIKFIQKLSLEADDLIRQAGLNPEVDDDGSNIYSAKNNEENDDEILSKTKFVTIQDTKWSGQSNVEIVRKSSNNWGDLLSRPGLAFGDVSSFILFSIIGRSQHNENEGILDIFMTAFPFLITWLIFSPFLGTYSRQSTSSMSAIPLAVVPSVLMTTVGGVCIRSIINGYIPSVIFGVVTVITTSILIMSWRALYVKLNGATNDNINENKDAGVLEVFKMIGTLIKRW